MTILIANISSGPGTIAHVNKVITDKDWEKVILIATEETKNFKCEKPSEMIIINPNNPLPELKQEITAKLRDKLKGQFEVAINFISGSGKEHMALISSLLSLGLGFRLIALTKDGVKEI